MACLSPLALGPLALGALALGALLAALGRPGPRPLALGPLTGPTSPDWPWVPSNRGHSVVLDRKVQSGPFWQNFFAGSSSTH